MKKIFFARPIQQSICGEQKEKMGVKEVDNNPAIAKSLSEVDRKMLLVNILDAPGCVMVGLGVYAKFGANGNAFHPLLENDQFVNGMLLLGVLIVAWGGSQIFKLSKERKQLLAEQKQFGS